MTSELYEPLIERDFDAFPPVAHAFLEAHSVEELWVAVEARMGGKTRWGAGLHASIVTASLRAVVSAVNRV